MQTHRCKHIYKPPQANPQSKVCKRASTSPAQEKLFFKISLPSKNFKTATADVVAHLRKPNEKKNSDNIYCSLDFDFL
jgi:methionyl-tRNA synthetase